jgi:hypothetical protein
MAKLAPLYYAGLDKWLGGLIVDLAILSVDAVQKPSQGPISEEPVFLCVIYNPCNLAYPVLVPNVFNRQ